MRLALSLTAQLRPRWVLELDPMRHLQESVALGKRNVGVGNQGSRRRRLRLIEVKGASHSMEAYRWLLALSGRSVRQRHSASRN